MTTEPAQRYEVRFQPAARRAVAQRLPEAVAAAVLEFAMPRSQLTPPRRQAIVRPARWLSRARRGTYRVVYRIDEDAHIVHVLDIDHRSEIYHRPQS